MRAIVRRITAYYTRSAHHRQTVSNSKYLCNSEPLKKKHLCSCLHHVCAAIAAAVH
jgi:hypothetical protein